MKRRFSAPALRALLFGCALHAALAAEPAPVAVPPATHPGAGQTFYFLLTDRFANGSPANDRGGLAGGPEVHGFDPTRISHYHGGDFAGLVARLDYLRHLGITALWITPPFRNKPMQSGTAGYHGYWVLDFLHVDPHLGTDEEFRALIREAHARGMKVFMDIITNHTADVIQYRDGTAYRDEASAPYRDAAGRPFDARAFAWNGVTPAEFPTLAAATSFPHEPVVPAAERAAKNPAWLNDVTVYHNRGNSTFQGRSAVDGDFVGLDDLFTEQPRVVQGFIAIFTHWLETTGVDGFRIDTAKHVNAEFWQAFAPALRARARALGRPQFLQFGEVYSEQGDARLLSEFSTGIPLDATLDFGFFAAARNFVSRGRSAAELAAFFAHDDDYTDHDSNVHATTTFLGNHDAGRFGYFLQRDNPDASDAQRLALVELGHGLMFLVRGQPVLYYGDEQGLIGAGGGDMQARESMFAAQAPEFRAAKRLGTTRTGADDKFDEQHPLYRFFRVLAALRAAHPALARGAMIVRATDEPAVFAFSRVQRTERVEYLVALNNSRTAARTVRVPTSQPAGAGLRRIFDSRTPEDPGAATCVADADGGVEVTLEPLAFSVWRAAAPLPAPSQAPAIRWVAPETGATLTFTSREVDGQVFLSRVPLRVEVTGGDGCAEVTFALRRASRPDEYELVGTDDAPPYRVDWRPPPDLAPEEKLTFIATVDDLRGHRAAVEIAGLTCGPRPVQFGIRGATVPHLTAAMPRTTRVAPGAALTLRAAAAGTPPLDYSWLRDGQEIAGASDATLRIAHVSAGEAGHYRVMVRNRAGTVLSEETEVTLESERR